MLGLEPNVDARLDDSVRDASPVRVCLDETFSGPTLDTARWEKAAPTGTTITTMQKLEFTFDTSVMQDAIAYVRTKATFDLTGGEIEAMLGMRPGLGTETRLQLYEMRIIPTPPAGSVQLYSHGTRVKDVSLDGNFLRIKVQNNEIVFGSGNTLGTYSADATALTEASTGLKIQISAVATIAAAAASITWPRISVKCR